MLSQQSSSSSARRKAPQGAKRVVAPSPPRGDSEEESGGEEGESLSLAELELSEVSHGSSSSSASTPSEEEEEVEVTFHNLDLNETKRVVSELIDTCMDLDEKQGFQKNEDGLIANQVQKSRLLFESQFGVVARRRRHSAGTSTSTLSQGLIKMEPESRPGSPMLSPVGRGKGRSRNRPSMASEPTEEEARADNSVVAEATMAAMFLAYKHTKMCTALVRKQAQLLGVNNKEFSVDEYLTAVRKLGMDMIGGYSPRTALEKLAAATLSNTKTFPCMLSLHGAFVHQEFLEKQGLDPIEKIKPERAKRAKRFETGAVERYEVVNVEEERGGATQGDERVEPQNLKIRRELTNFCHEQTGPVNLFEFSVNKDSMIETLNNTMAIAFGVRDGMIKMTRSDDVGLAHTVAGFSLTPSNPPKEAVGPGGRADNVNRRQHIMSISSVVLKKMLKMAQGDPAIVPPPPRPEKEPEQLALPAPDLSQ